MRPDKDGKFWDEHNVHPDEGNADADPDKGWWFSPDGIGRVWYDSLAEAVADTGLEPHPSYGV